MSIDSQDEYLTFFEATHVEKDGEMFRIIPSGAFCEFFITSEDEEDGGKILITLEDLNNCGYMPIDLRSEVEMDPQTGVPVDAVEHLKQMLDKKTTSVLDWEPRE